MKKWILLAMFSLSACGFDIPSPEPKFTNEDIPAIDSNALSLVDKMITNFKNDNNFPDVTYEVLDNGTIIKDTKTAVTYVNTQISQDEDTLNLSFRCTSTLSITLANDGSKEILTECEVSRK